jgi:hypothetical protein
MDHFFTSFSKRVEILWISAPTFYIPQFSIQRQGKADFHRAGAFDFGAAKRRRVSLENRMTV